MHHDDSDLAVIVVSQQFELVNTSGVPVADFTNSNIFGAYPGLVFHHLSPVMPDSYLYWSTDPTHIRASQVVSLQGPKPTAGGGNSPFVYVQTFDTNVVQAGAQVDANPVDASTAAVYAIRRSSSDVNAQVAARDANSTLAQVVASGTAGASNVLVSADTLFLSAVGAGNGDINLNPTLNVKINGSKYVYGQDLWTTATGAVLFGGSTTNVTSSVRYRKLANDDVEVEVGWTTNGAVTVGPLTINLPYPVAGIAGGLNTYIPIGMATAIDQGIARYGGYQVYLNVDLGSSTAQIQNNVGGLGGFTDTSPFTWGASDAGIAILKYRT